MKKTFKAIIKEIFSFTLAISILMSFFTEIPMVSASEVPVPIWNGDKSKTITALAGSGTETDPYLISDGAELYAAITGGANTASKYFKMNKDIYLNDIKTEDYSSWTPVDKPANDWVTNGATEFRGVLDGNWHTIYGLYECMVTLKADGTYTYANQDYYGGLIPILNGTIKNLNIRQSSVLAPSYSGIVTGYTKAGAVISSCSVAEAKVFVSRKDTSAGGITGRLTGNSTVSNCASYDVVLDTNGGNVCGGIVGNGWTTPGTIENCFCAGYYPTGSNATQFTIKNVYSNLSKSANGQSNSKIITLPLNTMQGINALQTMKLPMNIWSATDGYPVPTLKILCKNVVGAFTDIYFCPGERYEDLSISAAGLTFVGWYLDEDFLDAAVGVINEDTPIWAKWEEPETVNFDTVKGDTLFRLPDDIAYNTENTVGIGGSAALQINQGSGEFDSQTIQINLTDQNGKYVHTMPGHTYKVTFSVKDQWRKEDGKKYSLKRMLYISNKSGFIGGYKDGCFSDSRGNQAVIYLSDYDSQVEWLDVELTFTENSDISQPISLVLYDTVEGFAIDNFKFEDTTFLSSTVSDTDYDVNRDGSFNILDLVYLKKEIVGLTNINNYSDIHKEPDTIRIDSNDLITLKRGLLLGSDSIPSDITSLSAVSASYGSNAEFGPLYDNDKLTYNSYSYGTDPSQETTLNFSFDASYALSTLNLYRRNNANGYDCGFPLDFVVEARTKNGWVTVAEYKNYDALQSNVLSIDMKEIACDSIRIKASRLDFAKENGIKTGYMLSFAEVDIFGIQTDDIWLDESELQSVEGLELDNELGALYNGLKNGWSGGNRVQTSKYIFIPAGSMLLCDSGYTYSTYLYDSDFIWQPEWYTGVKASWDSSGKNPEWTSKSIRVMQDCFLRYSVNAPAKISETQAAIDTLAAKLKIKVPASRIQDVKTVDIQDIALLNYAVEEENTINEIASVKSQGAVNYIFITDTHQGSNDEAVTRQMNEIVSLVTKLNFDNDTDNDIDFVCVGGDITTGMYTSKQSYYRGVDLILSPLNDLKSLGVPLVNVRGNHDDNSYQYYFGGIRTSTTMTDEEKVNYFNDTVITPAEWNENVANKYTGDSTLFVHDTQNANSVYYYYDIADKKTRVICLDSIDSGVFGIESCGSNYWGYSAQQMKWLAETALTKDEDWQYIFLSHMGFGKAIMSSGGYHYLDTLEEIMEAAQFNQNYAQSFAVGDETVTITRNFCDIPTGRILSYQFGHQHLDYSYYDNHMGIAVMTIGTSGQYTNGVEESINNVGDNAGKIYKRVNGKSSEALFDIVSVDSLNISSIRFGAGENRYYTVQEPNPELVWPYCGNDYSDNCIDYNEIGSSNGAFWVTNLIQADTRNGNAQCLTSTNFIHLPAGTVLYSEKEAKILLFDSDYGFLRTDLIKASGSGMNGSLNGAFASHFRYILTEDCWLRYSIQDQSFNTGTATADERIALLSAFHIAVPNDSIHKIAIKSYEDMRRAN